MTESRVWFTGDTHYGHSRVLEYCSRPFSSMEEMDEALIERWNAVVKPGDRVFHLGDFALCKAERAIAIARRLKGQKFLIFGNHDKRLRDNVEFLGTWIWARDMAQIEVLDQKITLLHYAMKVWNQRHYGAWQLYGHSHGSLPEDERSKQCDVGVDCWDYSPVSFETIKEHLAGRHSDPVDHHEEHADG